MKLKRLFWANILILVLFTSCVSKPLKIPGDSTKTRDNIYSEYMLIADSYYELEKYDKAITYYTLCLENRKLYWAAYYKLAKTKVLTKNWNEALKMYQKIQKRDKDNDTIKASIAYIYAMQGNTDEALAIYEELLTKQNENQEYLENYVALKMISKDIDEIQTAIDLLKSKYPDDKNLEIFNNKLQKIIEEKDKGNENSSEENDLSAGENINTEDTELQKTE